MAWLDFVPRYTTGYRESPPILLSDQDTHVETSVVSWEAVLPTGTSITVEVSVSADSGGSWSPWQECVNGGEVPIIHDLESINGVAIKTKTTLTTSDPYVTPELQELFIGVVRLWPETSLTLEKTTLTDWDVFAITWTSEHLSLAVNGEELAQVAVMGPIQLGDYVYIGSDRKGQNQVNTLIDDLRISSCVRSAEELLNAYQSDQPLSIDRDTVYKFGFDGNLRYGRGAYRLSPPIYAGVRSQFAKTSWQVETPDNTNLEVELSWDGGDTWKRCTNGAVIPIEKFDATNPSCLFRQTLITTTDDASPTIQDLVIDDIGAIFEKALLIEASAADETLTVPTSGVMANEGPWTIGCWSKTNAEDNSRILFEAWPKFKVGLSPQNEVQLSWTDGTEKTAKSSVAIERPNEWHHWAYVFDGTVSQVYLDGVKVVAEETALVETLPKQIELGTSWEGLIDNFWVSSVARTEAEVRAAYASGVPSDWDIHTTYLLNFDQHLKLPVDRQGVWVSPIQNASAAEDTDLVVTWAEEVPINTAIAVQVRTSPDGENWSMWYDQVNAETAWAPPNPYSQIRVIIQELGNTKTPALQRLTVSYEGAPTASVLLNGLSPTPQCSFTQLQDRLIVCNGSDIPKQYDGEEISDIEDAPRAALACTYKNRIFLAKDAVNRSTVWFSGILDVEDWTSQSTGSIDVNPSDGDEIMALVPTSMTLLIVKQHTTYFLQGYSPQTFQVTPAGEGGTISPWGVLWTPYGVFRIDRDGVWATDFTKHVLLTRKIQRLWDRVNQRALPKASLHFRRDKLLVAVPNGLSNYNDLLLVYDLHHRAWTVWTELTPACFTTFWERGDWVHLFGSARTGNVFELGDYTTDSGVPIRGIIETKHLPLVSEEFLKRFKWLDAYFGGGDTQTTVSAWFVVDGKASAAKTLRVPAGIDSAPYRLYPPPFGHTIAAKLLLEGSAVLQGMSLTYFPRTTRPQRVI